MCLSCTLISSLTISVGCGWTQVTFEGRVENFRVQFLGTKGDWPFLRAAYRLWTGFTSTRICHVCPAEATRMHG